MIGDVLVAQGLATPEDVQVALELQRKEGGILGEKLVAMGKLEPVALKQLMNSPPASPRNIKDTGLSPTDLLNLVCKAMYSGAETPSGISATLMLPIPVVQLVLDNAKQRKMLDVLGSAQSSASSEMRYALTEKGRHWAKDAFDQNQYLGPAPVSLNAMVDRIERQRITNERVDQEAIKKAFANLVISEEFVQRIGPAINSGRSILLYGPPGNGKTSVAEKIGSIFSDTIYIPYCFEVEGQIIKVFDPGLHTRVDTAAPTGRQTLRREDFDTRWVPCRRPFTVAGGELTLEMLDLSYSPVAKFYEAPLHIKTLGGVFAIDDFGRQLISPEELLNRWIVPLESRVEYLKLHTGKSFSLPFDELVVFSTNLAPSDLMDPAFLRRIPYKIEIGGPKPEEYRKIFKIVAGKMEIETPDEVVDLIIHRLCKENDHPLASYQPKFIIDQVIAACRFEGTKQQFRIDLIDMALGNMHVKE